MQQPQEPQPMQPQASPQPVAASQPAQPQPWQGTAPQQPAQPQQGWQTPQPAQPQPASQPSMPAQPYPSQGFDQQAYRQDQAYGQPPMPGYQAVYPMTEFDRTLRLIAFILNILSLVAAAILIIPLAWMIPMCVRSWGIYKGTKPNTVAFGVCTLIFLSLIGGILLLISKKDR